MSVKVILADDHPIVRHGLRRLLESKSEFQVVGETEDGLEVLPLVEKLKPDVLILDLMMPGLNGLEAARQVRDQARNVRILILSMHKEDGYVLQALRNGAHGYIIKDSGPSELFDAIHTVLGGSRYLSPQLAERLGDRLNNHLTEGSNEMLMDPYEKLTNREREVLQLVAEGYTAQEIALKLTISRRTAEQHRGNVMHKLGLQNQREVVRYAILRGLLSLEG